MDSKCVDVFQKSFVAYTVEVTTNFENYSINHLRYSNFLTLHQELSKKYPHEMEFFEFPPKIMRINENDLKKRMNSLNSYFSKILSSNQIIFDQSFIKLFSPLASKYVMKCYAFEKYGDPQDVLQLYPNRYIPILQDTDVLVEVHSISLNELDLKFMKGFFF